MFYTKPQIVDLGSAIAVVKGSGTGKVACTADAEGPSHPDSNGCAYEADE
jgi:hypothetical protein